MGGEKFDTPHPEGYLFGENMDLNFLGNRPVQVGHGGVGTWAVAARSSPPLSIASFEDKQALSHLTWAELLAGCVYVCAGVMSWHCPLRGWTAADSSLGDRVATAEPNAARLWGLWIVMDLIPGLLDDFL